MAIPRPMTATQVRNTRMKTSGRSIWNRWSRIGSPLSSNGLPIEYRWPIPMAASPSPIRAPAAMMAPVSARMCVLLLGVGRGLHVEHLQPAPADEQDAGQDDEQAA